jgi:hypothetical protein
MEDDGALPSWPDDWGRAAPSFWDLLVAEALHGREPIVGDVGPWGENPQAVWNHVAKLHGAEGGAAYAPRRSGIPAKPGSAPAMPDAGQVPPANTIVGDAILSLVRLRARYR